MTLIAVTQDHINRGIVEDAECCPIALALRDTIPGTWEVHPEDIRNNGIPAFNLSPSLVAWICAYDNGEKMNPIDVYLDDAGEYADMELVT